MLLSPSHEYDVTNDSYDNALILGRVPIVILATLLFQLSERAPAACVFKMMLHTVDSSENSSDNDDLFSPVLGRVASKFDLLTPTPDSGKHGNLEDTSPPDTLPRLHNTSWIGARVSPVPPDNEEDDDDEDIAIMAPYHKALQQASFVGMGSNSNTTANEQTTLLGRKIEKSTINARRSTSNNASNHSAFQSMNPSGGYPQQLEETTKNGNSTPYLYNHEYDHNGKLKDHATQQSKWAWLCCPWRSSSTPQRQSFSNCYWFLPFTTAVFLSLVGLHDVFLKYISWRRGTATTYSLMWTVPWLGPSTRSMLRFGAYCPSKIVTGLYSEQQQAIRISSDWWRILTSGLWVTSSLSEWAVLYACWCWAISACDKNNSRKTAATVTPVSAAQDPYWNNYDWDNNRFSYMATSQDKSSDTMLLSWPIVYILSTLTGQLWMMAFDYWEYSYEAELGYVVTISGCTSWGTAGVLCAKGMQYPNQRLELFCLAIALVLLNLLPNASIFGAIGACFFGWAFAGIWGRSDASSYGKKNVGSASVWQNQFLADSPAVRTYRGWTVWNGLSATIALSLWIVPIVYTIRYS